MDITGLTSVMNTSNITSDVGILMLSKNLSTMSDLGDNMTKMMESSVTPQLGQSIDVSV